MILVYQLVLGSIIDFSITVITTRLQIGPTLTIQIFLIYMVSNSNHNNRYTQRIANVQPIPKTGNRSNPQNYGPVAITSILSKILDKVINGKLMEYLETNKLLSDHQYGLRSARSTGDLMTYVSTISSTVMAKLEPLPLTYPKPLIASGTNRSLINWLDLDQTTN